MQLPGSSGSAVVLLKMLFIEFSTLFITYFFAVLASATTKRMREIMLTSASAMDCALLSSRFPKAIAIVVVKNKGMAISDCY